MNVTGSVVLGILYLSPGLFLVAGLTRLYSSSKPSLFEGQVSLFVVGAILASVVLHAGATGVAVVSAQLFHIPTPVPRDAAYLLLGDSRSSRYEAIILASLSHWVAIPTYFVLTNAAAFWIGRFINKLIRDKNPAGWYDLLTPPDAAFIWMTVDVEIGGESYLFAGVVDDFRVSSSGELDRVVLFGAVKRPLVRLTDAERTASAERYDENGWIAIPGEHVIVDLKASRTVNIDYWYEVDGQEPNSAEVPFDEGNDGPQSATAAQA